MKIIHTSAVLLALLCPISSYSQTGNFFQDLAKGLEDIAKGLESISDPQKAQSAPPNSSNSTRDPADTVPLKFKNSTGHAITGFAVAKPEDARFGENLVGNPLQPNITFDYPRHKEQCILNFYIKLANNTEKKINKVDACNVTIVDIDSSNFVRARSARMSSVADTLQTNLTPPNGNLTVAIRVANATPGCTVGDNRFRIPKSGWDLEFDNNKVVKLRAKNPEKYGAGDIYGVTQRDAWVGAKSSEPVALSFVCAE